MPRHWSRRQFLRRTAATAPLLAHLPAFAAAPSTRNFSFVFLGDLHLDKLEHHDFEWLRREKPDDIRQIENYSRITREIMPQLFSTVRETMAQARDNPIPFIIQAGDFVEGLCGNEALARRHNLDAIDFVKKSQIGAPFLFTKGNHDITGPWSGDAYAEIFHPFLSQQTAAFKGGGKISSGYYAIEHGEALFCFFDAYDKTSLEWLEGTLAKRTARHCFVIVHPPVVPYGARATWHLYSNPKETARREKLLDLLGKQNAVVLGGHIHKFNTLVRTTSGGGRFLQLALSSIIGSAQVSPKNTLEGVSAYNGDQIKVEPSFSPGTEQQRRAVYENERKFVRQFQYADLPGHALITIEGPRVTAKVFSGVGREVWRELDLSKLLSA